MNSPRGLIDFENTPLGRELVKSAFKQYFLLAVVFSVLTFIALFWVMDFLLLSIIIILILSLFYFSTERYVNRNLKVPLVVNLNHPFMETDSVGNSEIMVKFSDEWIDPGKHRLKLGSDSILSWVVHKQNDDFSLLSTWDSSLNEKTLNKQLSIINQAISLNNAVNESNDEFEDARSREKQESSLLEREWLPEEEIEIQGPLSRIFSPE